MMYFYDNPTFENGHSGQRHQNGRLSSIEGHYIPQLQQVTLSWSDVKVTASTRNSCRTDNCSKIILNEVSGYVRPGRLVAIMGASGAGKTSLMNVLTFRNIRDLSVNGDIKINDRVVTRDQMNEISAYLQQEDLFLGTMTVREHLLFRASLQLDVDVKTRQRRVERVITELGLSKCADSVIDRPYSNQRISGGERKRLSFASELLMNPPLMFCDEPTSGLDSFMALSVIQSLKMLVHKGHTVLCTIHQPSSEVFALFDEIYLLAEGKCVFTGNTMFGLDFFQSQGFPCPRNYNPADHFILTLATVPGHTATCHSRIERLCNEFRKNQKNDENCRNREIHLNRRKLLPRYQAPFLKQFSYLLWRSWITNLRNPHLVLFKIVQTILFAVILGLFYLKTDNFYKQDDVMNINGCIFFAIVSLSLDSIFPILNVFPSEVPIFVREYGCNLYRVDIYYLSKIIVEIPFHILTPAIFMTILYFMSGLLYEKVEFFTAVGIAALVANAAAGFGYTISAGAPSITAALALAPLLLMPLMMNGGFFLNNRTVPVYFLWIKYSSWFMYSNELMILNQWTNVDRIECNNNSTCFSNGNLVIDSLGYDKENIPTDWICLAALTVAFRILSFIILFIKAKLST
uniref:Protein white-like n=1 Tax=Crassostrea virginica TaxID=6565 RepID=A0A8B8BSL2_CRAVI|nr:protein white-like [Crassostrea virginica]